MRFLTTLLLVAMLPVVPASGLAATLEQVLATMDRTAPAFRDLSANLTCVEYTPIINDSSEATGSVRMKRAGPNDVRILVDYVKPDAKTAAFEKNQGQVYLPKMRTVQIYELGKYRSLVDQFLLLGFGSSGKELMSSYNLKVLGEEQVGGEPATRLELIPKSPSVLEYLPKAELWISTAGYPLQQKFYQPSGYKLFTYSGVKLNTNLPDDAVKLKLPSGVKREPMLK
jgi:outer membrane lipoprotein-sorting protein